jgi:hypothetical protein
MKHSFIALAITVAVCASCASSPNSPYAGSARAPDPGKETSGLSKNWIASGKSYPEAGLFSGPIAWEAGQYIVTGTIAKGKYEQVTRQLIVGKEGDGWVIESISTDKKGITTGSQMLLKGLDAAMSSGNYGNITIGWMKQLNEKGEVNTVDAEQMRFFASFIKPVYESMLTSVGEFIEAGTIQVPAGSFAGTSLIETETKVLGKSIKSKTWYHSAVPINGMVKSLSDDGSTLIELLSWGTDGEPRIK